MFVADFFKSFKGLFLFLPYLKIKMLTNLSSMLQTFTNQKYEYWSISSLTDNKQPEHFSEPLLVEISSHYQSYICIF